MYKDWVKLLTSNWSVQPDDGICKKSLGTGEFFRRFPDEEAARLFLERRRWGERPACPKCGSEEKQYSQKRGGKQGYYRCNHCTLVYTVRTQTFMERSHVPLHKWLYLIHCFETRNNPNLPRAGWLYISLGISHTASSFMIQRIYDAKKSNSRHLQCGGFLNDIIPIAETAITVSEKELAAWWARAANPQEYARRERQEYARKARQAREKLRQLEFELSLPSREFSKWRPFSRVLVEHRNLSKQLREWTRLARAPARGQGEGLRQHKVGNKQGTAPAKERVRLETVMRVLDSITFTMPGKIWQFFDMVYTQFEVL